MAAIVCSCIGLLWLTVRKCVVSNEVAMLTDLRQLGLPSFQLVGIKPGVDDKVSLPLTSLE